MSCDVTICNGFFGGVPQLQDGVGVRIVDVDFDATPSMASTQPAPSSDPSSGVTTGRAQITLQGDAPKADVSLQGDAAAEVAPPAPRKVKPKIARVKLVLVDSRGGNVGQAAWASLHDLLERLADEALAAYDFISESEIRRRTRERLHRKERCGPTAQASASSRRKWWLRWDWAGGRRSGWTCGMTVREGSRCRALTAAVALIGPLQHTAGTLLSRSPELE